jgi:hypothetical protein
MRPKGLCSSLKVLEPVWNYFQILSLSIEKSPKEFFWQKKERKKKHNLKHALEMQICSKLPLKTKLDLFIWIWIPSNFLKYEILIFTNLNHPLYQTV